jgi:hypothetical protein
VPHVFETAPSGRAKCRGCGRAIQRGEIRFGERLPNQYGEGEMTLWFHPLCAAFKRAEPLLETLPHAPEGLEGREDLEYAARRSLAHRRLPRVDGTERARSGQAKCRSCRRAIERGTWRVRLVFYEEGRFSAGGYIHLACHPVYFEGHDALEPMLHFSPDLDENERNDLRRAYRAAPASPASSDNTRDPA